jgi:AhpD family alkylhydroperoxidase
MEGVFAVDGRNNLVDEIKTHANELGRAIPETMRAYQTLMKAASSAGELPTKVKELMAMAIGIALRCDGCIAYHVENARKHGATRAEVAESIGVAIEMGGGPATVYGGIALSIYDSKS